MFSRILKVFCVCTAALLMVQPAVAQDTSVGRLSGTLQKIKASGVIRLGHRLNSPPFSYLDARGQPVGYSVDLCLALVEDVMAELGVEDLRVDFRPLTPENRFAMLASGEVDIECGSTTDSPERRKQVAFSPTIFVTGTKLLVRKDGSIKSINDLKGKSVAVTLGTSNAATMQLLSERRHLSLNLIASADHSGALELLAAGQVEAVANDEVLLYGLLAQTRGEKQYRVVGDFLSYDPYGLMFRRDDPAFAQTIERGFRRLATSRELVWIYEKWFLKRLPSGLRMGLPMSPQLEQLFQIMGLNAE